MDEYSLWILIATWIAVFATIVFGVIASRQTQKSNKLVQMEISNKLKPILEIRVIKFDFNNAPISIARLFQILKEQKSDWNVNIPITNVGLLTAKNVIIFWNISATQTSHDQSHKFKKLKSNIPPQAGFTYSAEFTNLAEFINNSTMLDKFYLSFCIEYQWNSVDNNQMPKNHKFYLYEITSNDIRLVTYTATND